VYRGEQSPLTESKRRIVTLLYKDGPHTKRMLTEKGHMGWATVVKAITQLMDEGIIECSGIARRKKKRQGKDAYLYGLTAEKPLAIGVDVEYKTTRIVLTNLSGTALAQETYKTPQHVDDQEAKGFLRDSIADFMQRNNIQGANLDGIGIGIPGIGFPTSSRMDNIEKARMLERHLSEIFHTSIRIETNTKAYAVFEKWSNKTFSYRDFIFVSIRTGVGTGIFHLGNLFIGTHGLAGEIGHMKVVPNGPACRCGGSGCMETVVNQNYLFQQYRMNVIKEAGWSPRSSEVSLFEGLGDLFTRAKRKEEPAVAIVNTAASYLGHCIANAITVLDINNIIISGHFGHDGDAILDPLREVIRSDILPKVKVNLSYFPIDPNGHTRGAALLVLTDYFVDIPIQHDQNS
jgi:predicted NBD/HSP70 family sugar kinase